MMKSLIPWKEYNFMMCQRIGFSPISTIGLGLTWVSSLNLEPKPPAKITAFMKKRASRKTPVCNPNNNPNEVYSGYRKQMGNQFSRPIALLEGKVARLKINVSSLFSVDYGDCKDRLEAGNRTGWWRAERKPMDW